MDPLRLLAALLLLALAQATVLSDRTFQRRASGAQEVDSALDNDYSTTDLRAAMVITITRRAEVPQALRTIKNYEQRFNRNYHYDWIVIATRIMGNEYRDAIVNAISMDSCVRFIELKSLTALIGYPKDISRGQVRRNRKLVKLPLSHSKANLMLERHLARFFLGHFYNINSLWNDYDYYWKVPLNSQLVCDVAYDVFDHMRLKGIKFGWLLMRQDVDVMHPNLMNHVKQFYHVKRMDRNFEFLLAPESKTVTDFWKYRSCNFNSDFELVDVSFFRSEPYQRLFNYLDSFNGFYYETWTDAHIKTIAATLLLDKSELHYFDDLAVEIGSLSNCPKNADFYFSKNCVCNPTKHGKVVLGPKWGDGFQITSESTCYDIWLKNRNWALPLTHDTSENAPDVFGLFAWV